MCYHYAVTAEKEVLEERFQSYFNEVGDYLPVYHSDGFAHKAMPIITADAPYEIQLYNWGLIPHWVQDKASAKQLSNQTLNSVSETVYEKASFKSYIPNKRCLVLADGFFEWMHLGKEKYPYFIYLKCREPFAFAGIYSHWTDKEAGEIIKTYSILTTPANLLMEKIHNTKKRMPVILRRETERQWLDQSLMKDEIVNLMQPLEDEFMEAHTVSKLITSRTESSNQERVIQVCEYPELTV